jgi:hypothetical protein
MLIEEYTVLSVLQHAQLCIYPKPLLFASTILDENIRKLHEFLYPALVPTVEGARSGQRNEVKN